VTKARLVYFGVGSTPIRVKAAEEALVGQPPNEVAFEAAGQIAGKEIDPINDIHATADYRRAVAGTLTRRALGAALKKLRAD
jgi:carbon-monoxide dehydrogenase medium subunit